MPLTPAYTLSYPLTIQKLIICDGVRHTQHITKISRDEDDFDVLKLQTDKVKCCAPKWEKKGKKEKETHSHINKYLLFSSLLTSFCIRLHSFITLTSLTFLTNINEMTNNLNMLFNSLAFLFACLENVMENISQFIHWLKWHTTQIINSIAFTFSVLIEINHFHGNYRCVIQVKWTSKLYKYEQIHWQLQY